MDEQDALAWTLLDELRELSRAGLRLEAEASRIRDGVDRAWSMVQRPDAAIAAATAEVVRTASAYAGAKSRQPFIGHQYEEDAVIVAVDALRAARAGKQNNECRGSSEQSASRPITPAREAARAVDREDEVAGSIPAPGSTPSPAPSPWLDEQRAAKAEKKERDARVEADEPKPQGTAAKPGHPHATAAGESGEGAGKSRDEPAPGLQPAPSPAAVTGEALMVRIRLHSKASITMTEAYCAAEVALEAFAPVVAERDALASRAQWYISIIDTVLTSESFDPADALYEEMQAASSVHALDPTGTGDAQRLSDTLAERDALQARVEALEKDLAEAEAARDAALRETDLWKRERVWNGACTACEWEGPLHTTKFDALADKREHETICSKLRSAQPQPAQFDVVKVSILIGNALGLSLLQHDEILAILRKHAGPTTQKTEQALRDVVLESSEADLRDALGDDFDKLAERGRKAAERALAKPPAPEPAKPGHSWVCPPEAAAATCANCGAVYEGWSESKTKPCIAPAARAGEITDGLLPCPFCGLDAVCLNPNETRVACQECGAAGPLFVSEGDAGHAWNRRARALLAGTGRKPVVLPVSWDDWHPTEGAGSTYRRGYDAAIKEIRALLKRAGIEVADGEGAET